MHALENGKSAVQVDRQKLAWVKPEVSRMKAGEAALGVTPRAPEGAFGMGS